MKIVGDLWYKNRFLDNKTHELIYECVDLLKVTPKVGEIVGLKNCLYVVENSISKVDDIAPKNDGGEDYYIPVEIYVRFLRERDGL